MPPAPLSGPVNPISTTQRYHMSLRAPKHLRRGFEHHRAAAQVEPHPAVGGLGIRGQEDRLRVHPVLEDRHRRVGRAQLEDLVAVAAWLTAGMPAGRPARPAGNRDCRRVFSTLALSGKPSKNFSSPRRVSTLSGIAMPGGRVVVIFILGDAAHPGRAMPRIIRAARAVFNICVLLTVFAPFFQLPQYLASTILREERA